MTSDPKPDLDAWEYARPTYEIVTPDGVAHPVPARPWDGVVETVD